MIFKEVLAHVIDWLQQDQRISYRALKRQFALDNDYLDDLKVELIEVRRVAVEQDGEILVWRGAVAAVAPTAPSQHVPLTYTPPYLAEQILTFRSALEGERKQVTVLFADLKGSTELAALVQALARAGAGHGQVVALVGEAGVGKSRLVYEFVHVHHLQGWRVLESISVSYGKATPYFPVIDLLKRYSHVDDSDDPRTIRAKMTGQILTLDETLHDTLPALLALLDALPADSPFAQLDPPQRRQRTRDALKRVLLRESQVQPLLLVCEDLHWIDSETQALLDSLVESLPTVRILLLVNYRLEY